MPGSEKFSWVVRFSDGSVSIFKADYVNKSDLDYMLFNKDDTQVAHFPRLAVIFIAREDAISAK